MNTPNNRNMSRAMRAKILDGLLESYPDGTVTRQQLKTYAETTGQHVMWIPTALKYRTGARGVYRIKGLAATPEPSDPVATMAE